MLICLLLVSYNLQSQTVEELWKIYNQGHYAEVLEKAAPLLKQKPDDIDLRLLLGRTYTEVARYRDAIPHLEFVDQNDAQKTWRKAWGESYLGICYFGLGEYAKSRQFLDQSIAINATENVVKFAAKRKALFGFDDMYKAFKTEESEHITFHFHPAAVDSIGNTEAYINAREKAYDNIQAFFSGKLPKKADFFVWDSEASMKEILNSNAGFARPEFCIVHCQYDQTPGHELAHVISHYSDTILVKTALINEGTAVFFDQTSRNRLDAARAAMKKSGLKQISIQEMWDAQTTDSSILYPVSGAFIEYLIAEGGKENYLRLLKNQTYANAKTVYGDRLRRLVEGFEKLLK